jgi:uncharacterized membrane protein
VSRLRASLVTPTPATRVAALLIGLVIVGSFAFLVSRYPDLPGLLPVRFRRNGTAIGWQYKTFGRVLLPVFIQLALALSLGAVGLLLLSRRHGEPQALAPDVVAARTASEAVILITLIWVAFQGYASLALSEMWQTERAGLGRWYYYLQLVGLVLTGIVAVRAHVRLGRPAPRPFVADHWRFGQLYKNAEDPALFVPTRHGARWTLNFGRPVAAALLALILGIGIIGPAVILVLALRWN